MNLKKIGLLVMTGLIIGSVSIPSIVAVAEITPETETEIVTPEEQQVVNQVLKEMDSEKIIDNLLDAGYLAETNTGELQVTQAYVAETQAELGNEFSVSAEGNMLKITPNTPASRIAVPAGGVTGIVFEGTLVKLYLSQSMCELLLGGSIGVLKGILKTIVSLIPGIGGIIGDTIEKIIDTIIDQILDALGLGSLENGVVLIFGLTSEFPYIVIDAKPQEEDATAPADVLVSGLNIHPGTKELFVDEQWQLLPEFKPSNPTNRNLKWYSNNVDIASVEIDTGLITTKKAGTAVITAITQDGTNIEATATITVKDRTVHPSDVLVSPSYRELTIEQEETFTAEVLPANAENQNISWSSSDESIATIDATGKVTGISEGVATITAITEDGGITGTAVVKIGPKIISVDSITVTPKTKDLAIGETFLLDAEISPSNASNQEYVWSSDTPEVASISAKGLVTAKKAGLALITATSKDGDKIGTCIINVAKDEEPTPEKSIAMFRLYNPNTGEHFFTASSDEKNVLVDFGWRYEQIGWYAPEAGDAVYRMYNPVSGDHHYTSNVVERDFLVFSNWVFEGIGWYSDVNQTVPLYRSYNPNALTGNHNYTTNTGEHRSLLSIGWKDEGIGWYGVNQTK
ncbi:Ig-like domain-containing protein [Enterococcus sp. ALS3]|uniref:Ig-like domain-containing protein n=1 Tax=Enterococcus alishanensis TaxID=1303817 RepID=A0ABS6TE58_9ENTE|nr:Ig-like domain-containing protein [Enterococcus alishanensis]MBV7391217.1 Ig-like domain-containing protein [Enterococcus alishanensis]